jgi:hypothetical protein
MQTVLRGDAEEISKAELCYKNKTEMLSEHFWLQQSFSCFSESLQDEAKKNCILLCTRCTDLLLCITFISIDPCTFILWQGFGQTFILML